jgi:hypothetical protein
VALDFIKSILSGFTCIACGLVMQRSKAMLMSLTRAHLVALRGEFTLAQQSLALLDVFFI